MVARMLTGILASIFLPLGLVFATIGLLADDVDRGEPEDFLYAGLPLAAVGLGLAAVFVVLQRKEAARRARRRNGLRATAEVVDAKVNTSVRSSGRFATRLTVALPAGNVTTTVLMAPQRCPRPGDRIEVLYDPQEPENFEPVGT